MKNSEGLRLEQALRAAGTPQKAVALSRFFKTGKGEYGECDKFFGIAAPELKTIIKEFKLLPREELLKIIKSDWHEERMCALQIMVYQFNHADEKVKEIIFNDYLNHTKYINNWDLVDLSCPAIVGEWLKNRDRSLLYKLAESPVLWERRIAMVSCFTFIRNGENKTAFEIAKKLLSDKQDLIHKAVGWMLRETMKRCSEQDLLDFLRENYKSVPRTALRYSIEKFPAEKRREILSGVF